MPTLTNIPKIGLGDSDEIEQLEFIESPDRAALRELSREIIRKRTVLFVGAGLSLNAPRRDGDARRLPLWGTLATTLREHLTESHSHESDPTRVATLYESSSGRSSLIQRLQELIPDQEYMPGMAHELVCQLNFRAIVTTNFDTLIERAFEGLGIATRPVWEDSQLVDAPWRPRIVKMNGCLKHAASDIVITEGDFDQYEAKRPLIKNFVSSCLTEGHVCFIGFSFGDPVVRRILLEIRKSLKELTPKPFVLAVGMSPDERIKWIQEKMRPIDIPFAGGAETTRRIERVLEALLAEQRRAFAERRVIVRAPPNPEWAEGNEGRQHRLRRAARAGSIYDSGLQLSEFAWAPVLSDIESILAQPQPWSDDLVLAAWIGLQARVASDRLSVPGMTSLRPALRDSLGPSIERLMLQTDRPSEVNLRVRRQILLTLFAPVAHLAEFAKRLLDGRRGVGAHAVPVARHFDEPAEPGWWQGVSADTPLDESHIPVLSFVGAFDRVRPLMLMIADQLRRRARGRADAGPPAWQDSESCLRFSSLMRASGSDVWSSWPVPRFYRRELDRVAGRVVINPSLLGPYPRWPIDALLAALLTLARGWLFSEPPPPLRVAWREAEQEARRGGFTDAAVPWECLLIVTLPLDGDKVFARYGDLLSDAYWAGCIDLELLIDYAQRRLRDGGFTMLQRSNELEESRRGLFAYERGLAALLSWMMTMADHDDARADRIKSLAVGHLLAPMVQWLGSRPPREVRNSLVDAIAQMRRWKYAEVDDAVRQLLRTHAIDEDHVAAVQKLNDPRDGTELFIPETNLLGLIGWAQAKSGAGDRLRFGLQRWLIGWYRGGNLSSESSQDIERHLTRCLRHDMDNDIPDWLRLASWIMECPRLAQAVAASLHPEVPRHTRAFADLVAAHLDPPGGPQRWAWLMSQSSRHLRDLLPFVPHMSNTFQRLVERMIGQIAQVNEPARGRRQETHRDNALALLAALLLQDGIEPAIRDRWITTVEELLAQGAIGRGHLGPIVGQLSERGVMSLGENLSLLLADPRASDPQQIVAWATGSLPSDGSGRMSTLEERLIHAMASPEHRLASAALDAILQRIEADPSFLGRHGARLRHVITLVERRSQVEPSFRFHRGLKALFRRVSAPAPSA